MLKSITWVYGTCDLVLLSIHSICLIEYCHGYGRWAVPYMVIACAVLASLLDTTYDGGEWEPGYVIVLSTWIFFIFLLWVLLLAHLSSVFPSDNTLYYMYVLLHHDYTGMLHKSTNEFFPGECPLELPPYGGEFGLPSAGAGRGYRDMLGTRGKHDQFDWWEESSHLWWSQQRNVALLRCMGSGFPPWEGNGLEGCCETCKPIVSLKPTLFFLFPSFILLIFHLSFFTFVQGSYHWRCSRWTQRPCYCFIWSFCILVWGDQLCWGNCI